MNCSLNDLGEVSIFVARFSQLMWCRHFGDRVGQPQAVEELAAYGVATVLPPDEEASQ